MFNMPPRVVSAPSHPCLNPPRTKPGKRLPAATMPIVGNVCSIPPESSAAINVAGAIEIGKYCAVRAFVPLNLAQSLRAREDGPFRMPCGDVAGVGHWVRVHGQPGA